MGSEFTFYDYIDADSDGSNVIKIWLNGDGKPAKAHFMNTIPNLEASPPAGKKGSLWRWPYVWHLKGGWHGFIELRKEAQGVQYRLLGRICQRDVFLIGRGIHKDQHFTTDVKPRKAMDRVNQMISDPEKYRRKHEYN